MSQKNRLLVALMLGLAVLGLIGFVVYKRVAPDPSISPSALEELKAKRPDLTEIIGNIEQRVEQLAADPSRRETYVSLGFWWKSLADQTLDVAYYRQAMRVYEAGIELTKGKDALLIINAGNMARYVKDFSLAEKRYLAALALAPGDWSLYERLIELYEYDMKKSKDEILAVYDEAKKRVIATEPVDASREAFLARHPAE